MASTSNTNFTEYKLRCTLLGHTSDVRAVATTHAGEVVTASRDNTSRLWRKDENSRQLTCVSEYKGHTGYVTSVCTVAPSDAWPQGLVITGSHDKTILLYTPENVSPINQLTGHTETVSCLNASNGTLVSGSWDHTARVWALSAPNTVPCESELKAHNGPLWAVLLLPESQGILTASADTTIMLWKDKKVIQKYQGHTDCVRGLTLINNKSFLSCSNDASIRHWDILTGLCVASYFGHTNFIYSIDRIGTLEAAAGFVTSAEDRTVCVWGTEGQKLQTLHLPCQSGWSVAALPNNDVAVGASDGVCRVYTTAADRTASPAELQALTEQIAAASRPAAAELGGVNPDQLPDKTVLHIPGKKDGQTIMVREDNKVMCYSWSAAKVEWEAVGEVVGGTGGSNNTSGKVLYQGKEYDYVFNVELDEGAALKLPYNNGEDPYMAAQQFIDRHQLPQDHLEQVADFILKNSSGSSGPPPPSSTYFDPFTGGNRYVPTGGNSSSSSSRPSGDPFTSSGGYTPSFTASAPTNTGSSPMDTESSISTHFPQKSALLFESCNVNGITSKFKENNQLVEDGSLRLTDEEVELLFAGIFKNNQPASELLPDNLAPLEKSLQWSPQLVWPSLDLLRLCLRCKTVQQVWVAGDKGTSIVSLLLTLLGPTASNATKLLAIRCLANFAAHYPGREQLRQQCEKLIYALVALVPMPNKNMEIAAATLLLNCTVLLVESDSEPPVALDVVGALWTLLQSCKDSESLYRALVATGTIVSKGWPGCIQYARAADMVHQLRDICKGKDWPQKVKECAQHVKVLIKE